MFALISALFFLGLAFGVDPAGMPIDEGMRRENVTAEYWSAPAGVEAAEFARQAVEAAGLTNANGAPPYIATASSGYSGIAIISGDGRTISATYRPETNGNQICVVRAGGNGMGPAAYRAKRWCAAKFGIFVSEVPPPVIILGDLPDH